MFYLLHVNSFLLYSEQGLGEEVEEEEVAEEEEEEVVSDKVFLDSVPLE